MEEKRPTNVTEISTEELSSGESGAQGESHVSVSSSSSTKAPKNTIDLKKFQQSLARDDQKEAVPSLTWKDAKALKRSKYMENKDKYDVAYVLQNKRTKQVVEIQAKSSFHACTIIGWKAKKTKVIDMINVKERGVKVKSND